MLCILYVIALGTLLGIAGVFVERLLPPNASRRWVWMIVIAISMMVPPIYQAKHRLELTSAHGPDTSIWQAISSQDALLYPIWMTVSIALIAWALLHALYVSYSTRRKWTERVDVDGVPVVVTESLGPATIGALRPRVL